MLLFVILMRLFGVKVWIIVFKYATFADREEMIYQDLINNTIKGEDALLHYIDNWNTGTASDAAKAAWQRAARGVYSRSGAVSAHPGWAGIPYRRRW